MRAVFDFPAPDPDVAWQVEALEAGVVARYRRTIARSTRSVSGTGGYRDGVDFHTELHCPICCCAASVDSGCQHPAGGFFIFGSKHGMPGPWGTLIREMARAHLRDPVRH